MALANSQDHQPHLGLLLAALRLFQEVQKEINTLTRRHLDFYYQKILDQSPLSVYPIQLLVGLLPKPGTGVLPKNSNFNLIFPSKKSIPFQNPLLTELTQAKISDLRTSYKSNYYPFNAGTRRNQVALNVLYDAMLYEGEGKNEVNFGADFLSDLPMSMGEDQIQKGLTHRTMKNSLLGLVVSSPVLFVENGNHYFQLTFELSVASCQNFVQILSDLLHEKENVIGVDHNHSETELRGFIQAFLNEGLVVSMTAGSGWKNLEYFHLSFNEADYKLILKLELDGLEELPIGFDPILHGGISETSWPCIRLLLNNSAHYPPYRALKELEILEVEILTLSKGVSSGFECVNQVGKLDSGSPFFPFGPIPTKDSYLKIFNPLIFNKYLNRLSFKLTWMGLPEERLGFKSHYRAYQEEITNQSFQGFLTIKSAYENKDNFSQKVAQKVQLFDTIEKSDGEYLLKSKTIDLNLDLIDMTILKEPEKKSIGKSEPVYFFLKIAEPIPFAFGHDKYMQLFSDTSLFNSKFPKRKKELPNPAYTPQLEKIEFTYSNYTKENLGRRGVDSKETIKIFHLFSSGYTQIFPASGKGSSYFLPQLSGKGNLRIGLVGVVENELINLGFKLYPAFFIHTVTQPPAVSWEYMEKNQWVPLGNLLLEDSTHGLLQSGIVKIKMPSGIDLNNTRMPSKRFWLRISNSGSTEINSRLISVFTNAVWLNQAVESNPVEFKPNEFRESLKVVPNGNLSINEVTGPFHIKVPTLKKSLDQDRVRISELIRHRKRGISTWDLERIVLEKFPQIGRVMVYGRSDYPLHLVKGSNIQVVVIPHSSINSPFKTEGFRAPFELLQDIKKYLHSFISPFSKVEVCNPVFERLKIRAAVKFKVLQQSGYYRDILERELIEFLSPNPGDFQKATGFINSIYKAEIQNFIESRPYVDFVTGFSVLQIVEVQGIYKIIDTAESKYRVELLRTISPYAILTSSESHQLKIIYENFPKDSEVSSIGDLSIDSDFIINQTK